MFLQTTAAKVNAFLNKAVESNNLVQEIHAVHLYRLTHGGASHTLATGLISLVEIQRAGRWRSTNSLRRYEKGGRLSQLVEALPDNLHMMSAPQRLMALLRSL